MFHDRDAEKPSNAQPVMRANVDVVSTTKPPQISVAASVNYNPQLRASFQDRYSILASGAQIAPGKTIAAAAAAAAAAAIATMGVVPPNVSHNQPLPPS